MDARTLFPTRYVSVSDLNGRDVTVVINNVVVETLGDDSSKPVAYFVGTEKGLVLNKTNNNMIIEMHGTDTSNWIGKSVTLYPTKVEFQGKLTDAICIRYVPPKRESAFAPVAPPAP